MQPTWLPADTLPADPRATVRGDGPPLEPTERLGITLERELGRGGMGVVYAARQHALAREVAVKTVLPTGTEREQRHLLREAWLGGRLQHPNIIPVYDLLHDPDGRPQLVMKKLDGASWAHLLADRTRLPPDAGADPIAFHLEVLMAVCRAVEFAHDRGVIHRDIKPDNVMIGPFGEITLLDWGVAASLATDDAGRRPDLDGQTRLCGTPAYMPPEMFYADFSALGPAADVYLLGASLFEVLTGELLHAGPTLDAMRDLADRPPVIPSDLPTDLQRLLRRCLHTNPARRGTAAEVRLDLSRHLRSRDAERIAVRVDAALAELEAAIASGDVALVARHHGACAFGVHELRDRWPDGPRAAGAQRRLTRAIVPYLLGRGEVAAARIAAGDTDDAELLAALADAERRVDRDRDRLQALATFHDTRTGRVGRTALAATLGALWLGMPLGFAVVGLERGLPRTAIHSGVSTLVYAAILAMFWRSILPSNLNRSLYTIAAATPILAVPQAAALVWIGADDTTLAVARSSLDAIAVGYAALVVDGRLAPAAVIYAAAVLASAAAPAWTTPLLMTATAALVLSLIGLYAPRR